MFQGIDPNPDHILTYSLVSLEESYHSWEHNDTEGNVSLSIPFVSFQIDPNGTLTSLHPLDYEIDPREIPLLVRVTDQHGAFLERSFTVSVLNVVEDWDTDGVEDHYDPDDDGDGFEDIYELTYGFNPMDQWDYPKSPLITTGGAWEENGTLVFEANVRSTGGFRSSNWGYLCTIIPGISLLNYTNHGVPGRILISSLHELALEPGRKSSTRPMPKIRRAGRVGSVWLIGSVEIRPLPSGGVGMLCWQMAGESPSGLAPICPISEQLDIPPAVRLGLCANRWRDGMWLWMDGEDWLWTEASGLFYGRILKLTGFTRYIPKETATSTIIRPKLYAVKLQEIF